jgi:LDH2 family malate/lactate/ureidoglycolate dehydrogenase
MQAVGHTAEEARLIADHLIDCELRGLSYGGLPRALSIVERITKSPRRREPMHVEDKTAVSALVHGGDNVGYLVAWKAIELVIERAKTHGVAIIGANSTWYTGMIRRDVHHRIRASRFLQRLCKQTVDGAVYTPRCPCCGCRMIIF